MVFFRDEAGLLTLFYDGNFHELTEENVSWLRIDDQIVEFAVEDAVPLKLAYESSEKDLAAHLAATPMAEFEDFDFGLFVRNVMSNPERRKIIYRSR